MWHVGKFVSSVKSRNAVPYGLLSGGLAAPFGKTEGKTPFWEYPFPVPDIRRNSRLHEQGQPFRHQRRADKSTSHRDTVSGPHPIVVMAKVVRDSRPALDIVLLDLIVAHQ